MLERSFLKMELDTSFYTGLGCGICVGVSLFGLTKFQKSISVLRKLPSTKGCKLVFVVRTDLNMSKGKIAAQCGHAAVTAYSTALKSNPELVQLWRMTGQTKVALKTDSVKDIMHIEEKAKEIGLVTALIRDDGRTQIPHNSVTVLGVGPAPVDLVNKVTGHLKLL